MIAKNAVVNWRTLKGHPLLAEVISGVKFKDGYKKALKGSLPDVAVHNI